MMEMQHKRVSSRSSSSSSSLGKPPLPVRNTSTSFQGSMELSPDDTLSQRKEPESTLRRVDSGLVGEQLLEEPIIESLPELNCGKRSPSNGHMRRNTGGTIYLKNTMTNPDIQATIKCVCGVYRAHIASATAPDETRSPTSARTHPTNSFDVFRDPDSGLRKGRVPPAPSLGDLIEFYGAFYKRSRMEHDTIIMSLIYVERLVKATGGDLAPAQHNWRSILFACMVMASKVWDDLSMWNIDFSNVSANTNGLDSFSLNRINELELALLKHLNFDVRVPASEYAKYYFLIRSMLIRSNLVNEGEEPLRKQEAFKKLENLTHKYQDSKLPCRPVDRRTKSMDDSLAKMLALETPAPSTVLNDQICLEQLIG